MGMHHFNTLPESGNTNNDKQRPPSASTISVLNTLIETTQSTSSPPYKKTTNALSTGRATRIVE